MPGNVFTQTTFGWGQNGQGAGGGGGGGGGSGGGGDSQAAFGMPLQWNQPYWLGQGVNPYMRVYSNELDGALHYHCSATNTRYIHTASGHHRADVVDAYIDSIATKRHQITGGGGTAMGHGGHTDRLHMQMERNNTRGDGYNNHGMVYHESSTGGKVEMHPNHQKVTGKNYKHTIPNNNGALAMAVGGGSMSSDGQSSHQSNFCMTNTRIFTRTLGSQNMDGSATSGMDGAGGASGDQWNVADQSNINDVCGQKRNIQANNDISVRSMNGKIVIKAKDIVIDGNLSVNGTANVSMLTSVGQFQTPQANITNLWVTQGNMGAGQTGIPQQAQAITLNVGGTISS